MLYVNSCYNGLYKKEKRSSMWKFGKQDQQGRVAFNEVFSILAAKFRAGTSVKALTYSTDIGRVIVSMSGAVLIVSLPFR
jgi:hypothetical protein